MTIRVRTGDFSIPLDFNSFYDREAPLVLEVGFGDGRYLSHLGTAHPEWNLFGVEVSLGSLWRAYRRMIRDDIGHVRLWKGDAWFVVRELAAPQSLRRVYVNFPDPWPRKKHLNRRLLRKPFFDLLSTRLQDNGDLLLTTDHEPYYRFAIEQATECGLFDIVEGTPPPATLQTKYAMKWREMEKPIFHVVFRKREEAPLQPSTIEVKEMQHAVLKGSLSSIGAFEKQVHSYDGGHAIVLEAFKQLSGESILFKAVVEEKDLHQDLLIQAWQKTDGVYVSLQPFGDPLATKGVREAVVAVTDWLVSQGLELEGTWI